MNIKYLSVITGYYGSGKTNFAVNLAIRLADQGKQVTIIDLDTVNPYFRTSDLKELFAKRQIQLIAPLFAGTNLDLPALSGSINACLAQASDNQRVIIDVGGDDAGATPLGTYHELIQALDYNMYYLCNFYRMESETAEQAYEILQTIEQQSKLKATHLVGNSNLGEDTTPEAIRQSLPELKRLSRMAKLPVECVCAEREIADSVEMDEAVFELETFGRGGLSSFYS